ncbi:MAG: aspartate carbamoyltransferase catalytic subunit [Coriobacteriia bacterium]|nr:aspartate carbamoyltransferase catalytic subunit [Coriobacteriia bacterium]
MFARHNLLTIDDLTNAEIEQTLSTAQSFKEINEREIKKLPTLRGLTVINAFFEPSTRTRTSFEIAGKRLGADVINFSSSGSATAKGESLADTAATLDAMACDIVVVRHRYSGAPALLAGRMRGHIINGGDGMHQHPTQTLLDLFTMQEHIGTVKGKTIGIVGDIAHSRVAGSLAPALKRLGATPVFIAPPTYLPAVPEELGAEVAYALDDILADLDVVYLLRIQGERADGRAVPSLREYATHFGMNRLRMERLGAGAIVMHPGPMNRGVEISADVADDARCVVLDQVTAGVAVRMALMYLMVGGGTDVAAT